MIKLTVFDKSTVQNSGKGERRTWSRCSSSSHLTTLTTSSNITPQAPSPFSKHIFKLLNISLTKIHKLGPNTICLRRQECRFSENEVMKWSEVSYLANLISPSTTTQCFYQTVISTSHNEHLFLRIHDIRNSTTTWEFSSLSRNLSSLKNTK